MLLLLTQALPLLMLALAVVVPIPPSLVLVNLLLLCTRIGVLLSIARSYEQRGWPFWFSVFADPLAFLRVAWSTFKRPVVWRGRRYE